MVKLKNKYNNAVNSTLYICIYRLNNNSLLYLLISKSQRVRDVLRQSGSFTRDSGFVTSLAGSSCCLSLFTSVSSRVPRAVPVQEPAGFSRVAVVSDEGSPSCCRVWDVLCDFSLSGVVEVLGRSRSGRVLTILSWSRWHNTLLRMFCWCLSRYVFP